MTTWSRLDVIGIMRRAGIALLVAVGAFILGTRRVRDAVPLSSVVVARRDIAVGEMIDPRSIEVVRLRSRDVPSDAFSHVANVIGRVADVSIARGQAVTTTRLSGPFFEPMPTAGKRVMTLRVDGVADVSGLVQPNSHVDILQVLDHGTEKRRAKLVIEDVRLLAIESLPPRAANGAVGAATALVEVTPDQVARLVAASAEGQLQLLLRAVGDSTPTRHR